MKRYVWRRVLWGVLGVVSAIGFVAGLSLYHLGFIEPRLRPAYLQVVSRTLSPRSTQPLAFVGVTVLPMDGSRPRSLRDHTVLVQGGVIRAVEPRGASPLPQGTRTIDGRGRYLMPGLADMHVHVEEANELLLFVANGVTTVRNLWGNEGFKRFLGFADQLELRERVERGELLGPTLYTAGPILEGRPASNPFMKVVTSPEAAAREVARQAARGYDFVKVYDNLTPEVYRAVLEAADQHGLPVAGHAPVRVGLDAVLAGGQRSIEHLTGYLDPDRAELLIAEDALARYARWTRAAWVWNCPTFVIWQKRLPTTFDLERPELRYVSPRMRRLWRTFSGFMAASVRYEGDDYAARMKTLMLEVTGALHRAGAGLLLGTDTDNAYVIPGFSIYEELDHLAQAGLSPYEALRTGTANAAEALGKAGEFGTVTVGARADLILLEADPLDDVTHVQRRVGVMLRGRWLPEAELQVLLEGLAASYGQ